MGLRRFITIYNLCDHMSRLLLKYLAICKNDNLPNSIKNWTSRLKILPNTKFSLEQLLANLVTL